MRLDRRWESTKPLVGDFIDPCCTELQYARPPTACCSVLDFRLVVSHVYLAAGNSCENSDWKFADGWQEHTVMMVSTAATVLL